MQMRNILMGFIMTAGALSADFNDDVFSGDDSSFLNQQNTPLENLSGPFLVTAGGDWFGKAKFSDHEIRGQKLRFDNYNIDGSMIFGYNECRREGFVVELGYAHYTLDWNQNPYFDDNDFNMGTVSLGFFSHRLLDWNWDGFVKMNFSTDHLNFQDYVTWDIMLWGKYSLTDRWNLHMGFYALTGMKIDRLYPIFGLDWTISDKWRINAIFPLDFSVIYTYDCNWSVAIASRFWDVRQRAGKSEPLKKAVWEYRNVGVELAANYKYAGWNANAHVGYSTGGRLKISDRHKRHSHRLNFDGAPYVGGELAYNF